MLINRFDEACKNIDASYLKVGDELMGVTIFWITAKENLPHFSYILHMLDPLGT